mgnify:FL=1
MIIGLTLFVVVLATLSIFQLRTLTGNVPFKAHRDPQIDGLLKFQIAQFLLAWLVLGCASLLAPENFKVFFRLGNLDARISPVAWLGINGTESWRQIALVMGFWITAATGIYMALGLWRAGAKLSALPSVLLWVLFFSALNAFSEEAIFRLAIVAPLYGKLTVSTILLISAALFGVPHYFGTPSGIPGVLMAGFLGWLLALSLIETQGLLVAWALHFVQDVVIIGSTILITRRAGAGS